MAAATSTGAAQADEEEGEGGDEGRRRQGTKQGGRE